MIQARTEPFTDKSTNSYLSQVEFTELCSVRAVSENEVLLLEAHALFESYDFSGTPLNDIMSFPRDIKIGGFLYDTTVIPGIVKKVIGEIYIFLIKNDKSVNDVGGEILREKVGELETVYAKRTSAGVTLPNHVENLLNKLRNNSNFEIIRI